MCKLISNFCGIIPQFIWSSFGCYRCDSLLLQFHIHNCLPSDAKEAHPHPIPIPIHIPGRVLAYSNYQHIDIDTLGQVQSDSQGGIRIRIGIGIAIGTATYWHWRVESSGVEWNNHPRRSSETKSQALEISVTNSDSRSCPSCPVHP